VLPCREKREIEGDREKAWRRERALEFLVMAGTQEERKPSCVPSLLQTQSSALGSFSCLPFICLKRRKKTGETYKSDSCKHKIKSEW